MPTYEYECPQCGHAFEHFQSMVDAPLDACPKCGGAVRRLLGTGAGVILKGSAPSGGPSCGRDTPCCGRATPCDSRPCGE